ncbi:MAG: hypothetical protein H0W54_01455 [Rubrobacter sp.]|nr:hypothetical protein [Rubrobacter sp.]
MRSRSTVEDSGSDETELPLATTVEGAGREQLELALVVVTQVRSFFGCASSLEIHCHGAADSFLLLDIFALQQIAPAFEYDPEIRLAVLIDLLDIFQNTAIVEILQILSQVFLGHGPLYRDMQTIIGQNHIQYLDSVHLKSLF